MNQWATQAQLQQIGDDAVAQFDSRVSQIPESLRMAFAIEAMRLEDQLLFIYKMIAASCKDEDDLEKIASSWKFMVEMCDSVAGRLHCLKENHPAGGTDVYYDRILDLRNKCRRLQEMHT